MMLEPRCNRSYPAAADDMELDTCRRGRAGWPKSGRPARAGRRSRAAGLRGFPARGAALTLGPVEADARAAMAAHVVYRHRFQPSHFAAAQRRVALLVDDEDPLLTGLVLEVPHVTVIVDVAERGR